MYGEGDFRDVNVLLKMEKTNFKFVDLFLNGGDQLVSLTAGGKGVGLQLTVAKIHIQKCPFSSLENSWTAPTFGQ